jgi:MoaA/NifB/PqqE/SkfB family radical SAM enzyme
MGCRRVNIQGGEPLLRPDLPELIEHIRKMGMSCVLASNGLLVSQQIQKLGQVSTLVLSLDAAGPANDAVRGAGVFAAVKEAVAAARSSHIPVKVNAVLSARTVAGLDGLLAFAQAQDFFLTVNIMRSGSPDLWKDAARIKDDDQEIRRTLDRLAGLSRKNFRILFAEGVYRYAARWPDYSRDRLTADELTAAEKARLNAPRCQAGRFYVSVTPDGSAWPCVATIGKVSGGNVVGDGLAACWKRLAGHSCLACYSPCLVELNYLFSLKPRVLMAFLTRHLARFA